ncbi:MAG: response regulator [Thermodesulfobacteriota bacterium]|nr:response regulator [Thermodesulfobacteriota bacterium]
MNNREETIHLLRLLLIDDNPDDRALVTRELEKEFKIQVKEIIDAELFADTLKESNFDIVITDYQLRWSNGLEVLGKIKACRPDCPVIMFTASGNEEIAVKAMKNGLDDYVIKSPKHFKRLLTSIKAAIKEFQRLQEMRRTETALRESEEKYRLLVDNANDAIFIVQDKMVKFCNPKTEEIIGYSDEELANIPFVNHIHPDERDLVMEMHIRRLKGEKVPSTNSFRAIHKDGQELYGQINAVCITWEGRPAVLCLVRDLTLQKRLESQLQHAHKMEAIGTLAGGIAHDFNNLLMGIQGNISLMLLDIDSSHPYYERLKNVEQYVKSGAELTSQLLGFARGGRYEVKPTDLNQLIRNQNRMFGRTRKEITIHEKYDENLWALEADRGQMEQVLLNLYINAWQAMPGGGDLYIQTENVMMDENDVKPFDLEPGRYVKISITDTGVGMDEETQQRIFEPFFTTKEMGRGMGLGLASIYGIIKSHGGFIHVSSEKGGGATFDIYLPASEKEVLPEKEFVQEVLMGSETILLVDDEEMIIDTGRDILNTLGYNVFVSRSGKEAIEIYRKKKDNIDMVVLDMIMPGIGGGETYEKLKDINPAVKVLLSTGYSIDGQAADILNKGCNGFIQKPFNVRELSQKLREVLDQDNY